jgi:hypothetical protein
MAALNDEPLSSGEPVRAAVVAPVPAPQGVQALPHRGGRRAALRPLSERLMELAIPAHYLSLLAGLALLLYLDRHLWFIGDIFEFFARMQPGHSLSLLYPHNEHWSTIPILINLALYGAFGLTTYLPYLAADLVAHLVVAHLMWRWMIRVGADLWVATALAAAFVVLGGGAENLTSSFQIGFVLPVAIGLVAAFLQDHADQIGWRREAGFWVLGVAACMCSGIGVCMVLLGAALAWLRRGWLAGLRAASVPAAVYLVWLGAVGHAAASTTPAPTSELPMVVQYVWTGLTSAIEGTTGWVGLGGVLALGLGVWLYANRFSARGRAALAFAGPPVALIFFAIVGVGRISLGVQEAALSHYGYEWVVLLLPAAALALTQLAQRSMTGRWVALALAGVVAVDGVAGLSTWLSANNPTQEGEHGEILAAAHLIASGAPLAVGGGTKVEPVHSPDLTVSELRDMIMDGKVPMGTPVTATDLLDAALYLQVNVSHHPLAGGSPPALGTDIRPAPLASGAGCVTVANDGAPAALRLVFSSEGSVSLTPSEAGDLVVQLAPVDAPLDLTGTKSFPLVARSPVYLTVTAAGTAPLLSLPPGVTTVCGLSG